MGLATKVQDLFSEIDPEELTTLEKHIFRLCSESSWHDYAQMKKKFGEMKKFVEDFNEATDKQDAFEVAQDLVKKLPDFLKKTEKIFEEHADWEEDGARRRLYS